MGQPRAWHKPGLLLQPPRCFVASSLLFGGHVSGLAVKPIHPGPTLLEQAIRLAPHQLNDLFSNSIPFHFIAVRVICVYVCTEGGNNK